MSLFTKAIPITRPEINRRQNMIKWPELVAMALCAAIFLPGPAPATPHLDSALEATVADSIVAIREGKISVKLSPSRSCMQRLEIRRYIAATASCIRLTAVRACGASGIVQSALQGRGKQRTCRFRLRTGLLV